MFGLISRKIMHQAKKLRVDYSFMFVQPNGQQLAAIGALIDAGHITPVVDKVFPFAQSKEALTYLETGRAKGKVVVNMATN
jgi:NADPH:quinone reductase-like Zn-dependent oxidoreductase